MYITRNISAKESPEGTWPNKPIIACDWVFHVSEISKVKSGQYNSFTIIHKNHTLLLSYAITMLLIAFRAAIIKYGNLAI